MTSDKRDKGSHRIPIRFNDADDDVDSAGTDPSDEAVEVNLDSEDLFEGLEVDTDDGTGGPDTAELIATRSELKRIEAENAELKDKLQRRQADFENYRKRVERERTETYNRWLPTSPASCCR